ncbi:MAG: WYL domain-containing protein [Opitutaceae bacterium]|nr:WYL domain-containing protein [Opitutaceae bacterium]
MHRRSFLSLIGLVPLATAVSAPPEDNIPKPGPLPVEPWHDDPDALERWRRAIRQPVWESGLPELALLISCLNTDERVQFVYCSGSTPGKLRVVTPGQLYTVAGFPGHYLTGYCHLRDAERTFLVSRMSHLAMADAGKNQIINGIQPSH